MGNGHFLKGSVELMHNEILVNVHSSLFNDKNSRESCQRCASRAGRGPPDRRKCAANAERPATRDPGADRSRRKAFGSISNIARDSDSLGEWKSMLVVVHLLESTTIHPIRLWEAIQSLKWMLCSTPPPLLGQPEIRVPLPALC